MSNFANSFLFSDSTDTGNGHQAAQSRNLQCSFTESFQTEVAFIIVLARTTSKRPNLHLHSISICIIHISILVVPCNWTANNMHPGPPQPWLPVFSEPVKFQTGALYVVIQCWSSSSSHILLFHSAHVTAGNQDQCNQDQPKQLEQQINAPIKFQINT